VKIWFYQMGSAIARIFIARVQADGGVVVDTAHTRNVLRITGASLIVPCSAGKVSVLYGYTTLTE